MSKDPQKTPVERAPSGQSWHNLKRKQGRKEERGREEGGKEGQTKERGKRREGGRQAKKV